MKMLAVLRMTAQLQCCLYNLTPVKLVSTSTSHLAIALDFCREQTNNCANCFVSMVATMYVVL